MANTPTTPGVSIEEIVKLPPSVAAVATAVPAFIGYTERAIETDGSPLPNGLKRIASLVEYEQHFGGPQPETLITVAITDDASGTTAQATLPDTARSLHLMYYAVQMYFANGGGPAWVASAGTYKANLRDPLDVNELVAALDVVGKEDEPTLLVVPESQSLNIADYKTLHDLALTQCATLQDRFTIMDLHPGDADSMNDHAASWNTVSGAFRSNGIGTSHLKYGAVYAPNLATTLDAAYSETTTQVDVNGGGAVALDTLAGTSSKHYALAQAAIRDLPLALPPSGAIAGIYAAVDAARGVWKAPANVSVLGAIAPTVNCTDAEQGGLNVDSVAGKSINAIRAFTGRGTLVWGARTLAGNDNEWRYINVRRFFNMVEESTKNACEPFTFEPNDANTWVRVQAMIENFLTTLWRQGALQGAKPEHAFFVAVGLGKTMTALDILEGRMIVEIGMAAVRPAEFIVLRFSHMMAQS